jgi:hypothetical protein
MRIPRVPVLLFVFLLPNIFIGCNSEKLPEGNVIAKYGDGYTITFNDLEKYVKDWLYYKKFRDKSDAFNNALNDMLVNQFKRMDFFEKGLDNDSKLIQSISRIINEELVSYYFENEYLAKYANLEYAKKVYQKMDKQVVAQQIVLYKPENATPAKLESFKQKAIEIKSDIDEGLSIDSLVTRYSQDKQSLKDKGFMPPVDWKQSLIDPLGNIIFSLNKNDVRVLNDVNAFRIVKIVEINKVHVEPFDKIKNEIISNLKNIYYPTSINEYNKDLNGLIDETSLKWNENALKQILKWSNEPNFYKDKYEETFEFALENRNNETILIYNKGKVDYKEYLRLLNNILILPSSNNNITEEDLKNFILEAIRTDMIIKKANALDLKKNIFNSFTKNPTLQTQLVYLYNQAEIEANIPDTTDIALHKFFQENENSLYYQLEKRNIFVMVFADKAEAENALERIKHGTPFEKITGRYLVKTYIKDRNGEIKSFGNNEEPIFGKDAFNMKEVEVSNPIKFEDKDSHTKYVLLKCYYIRPEKQLTFNDVKNSIADDFKNYYRVKIGKDIEGRLKSKYHPEIFEGVLTNLLSSTSTD